MKFIYALNEQQRADLINLGFEEVCSCKINGETAYAFEECPQKFATFSKEDKSKYLISSVAYFV